MTTIPRYRWLVDEIWVDRPSPVIYAEAYVSGEWVKWSEVEALLLQRAQESQELLQAVLDAIKGTIDTSTNIADHPNVLFAQMERLKLESALTARAQEIEQVKARASTLEDAAFHFQSCATCAQDGESACFDGKKFAAFLRGEEVDE